MNNLSISPHPSVLLRFFGMSAKKIEMSYPDYAGRVRHLHSGPDGTLYVGDETRNAIFKVTPQ